MFEKTRKAYDQAVDKAYGLSDELSDLRSQAQDGKSKVATGRTKKRASEMTNAMKFNAALEAEAMNNGEAIPIMRKKANKNQMASLNDRINQKESEQAAALSRVNQLKVRANKLYNASVDYANKPDTATASATPKSRKVVKGMSPRDRKKKTNESLDDKVWREYAENFGRVMKDPRSASDKDLRRASNYADRMITHYKNKEMRGEGKANKDLIYSLETEMDSIKWILRERESKPKQPSSAAKRLNMTDAEYAAFKKKVARL